MIEFYSEATQSTTGFQIEKQSMTVTALGIDDEGNVWTGHAKGLIRVRRKAQVGRGSGGGGGHGLSAAVRVEAWVGQRAAVQPACVPLLPSCRVAVQLASCAYARQATCPFLLPLG